MSFERTWSGDWQSRILQRVRELGFETVTDYADHRVSTSLLALAHELGAEDVAGAQIQCVLLDEAKRTNTIPRLLRDLLVRELREALPQGWSHPLDDEARYRVAGAFADWWAELKDHLNHEMTTAASRAFLDAELPDSWLPDGVDDPVIVSFVDRCLGRAPS